jgi:hypothetical protein
MMARMADGPTGKAHVSGQSERPLGEIEHVELVTVEAIA